MTTVEAPAGAAGGTGRHASAPRPAARRRAPPGAATGVGSLPHRSVHDAAALRPARVRPAGDPDAAAPLAGRGMIAQALVGIDGVTLGQYGSIAVDVDAPRPEAPGRAPTSATTPSAACGRSSPTPRRGGSAARSSGSSSGPVTLGVALDAGRRAAPTPRSPSPCAPCASHLAALADRRGRRRCRSRRRSSWLDEPWFGELMQPGLPDRPRPGDRPAVERDGRCRAGRHRRRALLRRRRHRLAAGRRAGRCCRSRSHPQLVDVAGYLAPVPRDGGRIAWGVVPTDGPIPTSSERPWRQLSDVWCELVSRGCDPVAAAPAQPRHARSAGSGCTRRRSPTGSCGLTREIGRRVNEQAVASRFALGA